MAARYIEIKNSIKDDILRGRYQVGEKLPSERELAPVYGVTRVTIQKSTHMLEQEGFIERIHGKGMFVANTFAENVYFLNDGPSDTFLGFSREFGNKANITSRLISQQLIAAPGHIIKALNLTRDSHVHAIRRVRLIDMVPVLVEDSWIVQAVIPVIPASVLEKGSLYEYIEQLTNKKIKFYNSVIEASLFDESLASLLDVAVNSPMLKVTGTTKLDDGSLFNYSCSYNRADKFRVKNNWVEK